MPGSNELQAERVELNKCPRCHEPIFEDDIHYRVFDNLYHIDCLKCSDCELSLVKSACYSDEHGALFCEAHYFDNHAPKCLICNKMILSVDLITVRINRDCFHIECLRCNECQQLICPNDPINLIRVWDTVNSERKFVLCDNHYVGRQNTMNTANNVTGGSHPRVIEGITRNVDEAAGIRLVHGFAMSTSNDTFTQSNEVDSTPTMADTIPKRKSRTIISKKQLMILQNYYSRQKNPDYEGIQYLSGRTELQPRVVKVWFQNKRAAERRAQTKSANNASQVGEYRSSRSGDDDEAAKVIQELPDVINEFSCAYKLKEDDKLNFNE
ncbi:hypothetical protein ACOME3_010008 [Neoechinorhynchus agilis]